MEMCPVSTQLSTAHIRRFADKFCFESKREFHSLSTLSRFRLQFEKTLIKEKFWFRLAERNNDMKCTCTLLSKTVFKMKCINKPGLCIYE